MIFADIEVLIFVCKKKKVLIFIENWEIKLYEFYFYFF